MGSFYTNITLRHTDAAAVADALRELRRTAYVTPPARDTIVVFDATTEKQDPDELSRLAAQLSKRFGCAALGVLNHDDDVLWYTLYERGLERDTYDSNPGYFSGGPQTPAGGNADALRAAFGAGDREALERLLRRRDGRMMATEQHEALVSLLGTNEAAIGTGYNYVSEGEIPPGLSEDDLLHVGDASTEEATRSAAAPAIDPRQAAVRDAFIARFSKQGRVSPALWAIIGPDLPPSYQARPTFTVLELVGLVMRYLGPRVVQQGERSLQLDERLAALFGVKELTIVELMPLLEKYVTTDE